MDQIQLPKDVIGKVERRLASQIQSPSARRPEVDEKIARLRSHGNNIRRYHRLLQTKLSDVEREFIERRLHEEREAMESLTQADPIVLGQGEIDRMKQGSPVQ
jgi:hypothetical protein